MYCNVHVSIIALSELVAGSETFGHATAGQGRKCCYSCFACGKQLWGTRMGAVLHEDAWLKTGASKVTKSAGCSWRGSIQMGGMG